MLALRTLTFDSPMATYNAVRAYHGHLFGCSGGLNSLNWAIPARVEPKTHGLGFSRGFEKPEISHLRGIVQLLATEDRVREAAAETVKWKESADKLERSLEITKSELASMTRERDLLSRCCQEREVEVRTTATSFELLPLFLVKPFHSFFAFDSLLFQKIRAGQCEVSRGHCDLSEPHRP
jgi:hypothetical protein